jgi:hypothetical protein
MQAGDWVSLAAAVVAVVALIWTRGQARSARQQAESAKEQVALAKRQTEIQEQLYRDQQQPYLWVDFRADPVSYYLVDLVLKNEGPTIATNVRVIMDPPIQRSSTFTIEKSLLELPGFANGFASIPPGREMRWSLGTHVEIFEERTFHRHTVTIAFDGPFGPVDPVVYVLDYADAKAMALRDQGNLKSMTEALTKGNRELTRVLGRVERAMRTDDLQD